MNQIDAEMMKCNMVIFFAKSCGGGIKNYRFHTSDPHPPTSIQELNAAAIAEAQRTAREEYQKEIAHLAHKHQQETQAIREKLQQGAQSLRQDILTQAQHTAQLQQQQAADLQRI